MRTITCKIPEKLDVSLEALASKQGRSKSEIVRSALELFLDRETAAGKLTAYDLAKEFCGILKNGPRDLSTNPKHMKGFGRD